MFYGRLWTYGINSLGEGEEIVRATRIVGWERVVVSTNELDERWIVSDGTGASVGLGVQGRFRESYNTEVRRV